MQNFVSEGITVTVPAPTGGVTSGNGYLIGSLFGVAVTTAAEAADVGLRVMGIFDLPRETGGSTAWAVGDKVYWDNTNKRTTKTATSNTKIGIAVKAAADGDATGRLRLTPTW